MDRIGRHEYFVKRMRECGLYDKDADYDGQIAVVVEKMSAAFSTFGHSGASAALTMDIFNILMEEWNTGVEVLKF